jgi:type I restriction enzyme M protein
MALNNGELERRLWAAADQLWANTGLKPAEFSGPVLGLIFLRYAEQRFVRAEQELNQGNTSRRRSIGKTDFQAKGVLYLPEIARFSYLLNLTESDDIARAINDAMKVLEEENEDLRGVLPKSYTRLDTRTLVELLKLMASIPMDIEGDTFGKIYEYFLGAFAKLEGQKGGVFYTPTSIVKLIVEIMEPLRGRIFDPACGSGGMFVQSAGFVDRHSQAGTISIYGQEKAAETVKLCKMNLAVHGLSGDIKESNTYYDDPFKAAGQFDFVMANPPFNVSGIDKERLKGDSRFGLGLPSTDNGNYLWIQLFYSSLNEKGRAGFVMANSAGDARGSETEIRKRLIEAKAVDVIISVGPNFFYTVTLPCTLWFLDRGKKATNHEDSVLFIDARHIYQQIDRAHRDFLPEQIEFIANIVRLYRGEKPENLDGSGDLLKEHFPRGKYDDVAGLCKKASLKDIEKQGWSLNPGRYVGVADRPADDFVFTERFEELSEELEVLNAEARELETLIADNVAKILECV